MAQLTRPPRLAGLDNGQGPSSVGDWLSIYKFLISLWRKAADSATASEVEAIIGGHPPTGLPGGAAYGIPASLAFNVAGGLPPNTNAALSQAFQDPGKALIPGNLAGFLLANLSPPASSNSGAQVNPHPYGVVVQWTHNDRISVGTGTIAGNTLTWVSGPNFNPGWVGFQMAINGALFSVTAWASGTSLTLSGTPPTGAVGWEFMIYPANSVAVGTAFMETDHKVIYRVGDSFGTCNLSHSTVTWVSGPKFSPYWSGLPIVINSITYVVSFSTQTTLTLTADSGVVTSALVWVVGASSWFYETGIESLSMASFLARTFDTCDDGYRAEIFDFNHAIIYNGAGAAWGFANGDPGSKWITASADGSAPQGGPWQACDGSTVSVFEINTGAPALVNVIAPDLRSDTFLRGGAFTGSANATSSPTFSAGSLTFTGTPVTPTGTVSAPVFTGSALAAHQHISPIGTTSPTAGAITGDFGSAGGPQTEGAAFTIVSTAGSFAPLLDSLQSAGTPAGTNSAPTFTGASLTPAGTIGGSGAVGAPTVGSGAPKSFALLWYMRR